MNRFYANFSVESGFNEDSAQAEKHWRPQDRDLRTFQKAQGSADAFDVTGGKINVPEESFDDFTAFHAAVGEPELFLGACVKQGAVHDTSGKRRIDKLAFREAHVFQKAVFKQDILQAHMLEICPLIAAAKPRIEVHHLGIGVRKTPTARLVFTSKEGSGIAATIVDMGNRFRLIAADVECIKPKPLPKLPVASALWIPMPNFEIGAAAWIIAGGTHHSAFSYDITPEYWEDYAEIADIEMLHISKETSLESFKRDLRINEVYYLLNKALK